MRFKPDPVATAEANFCDHRSYVSFWLHPGTLAGHQYLFGDDVTQARRQVYEQAKGQCYQCKRKLDWDEAHMDHIQGGLGASRCYCIQNLRLACPGCHTEKHGRFPRWREQ